MKNIILAAALLAPFAAAADAAGDVTNKDYFTTGSVTVISEVSERALTPDDKFPVPLRNDAKAAPVAAGIVNGGVQAWNVINSGKPDANLSSSYASAIPGFGFNWANFSGWKKKEVIYTYTVTNLMQVDVIKIKYAISFYYNGQNLVGAGTPDNPETALVQRKTPEGHYITNFTVRPLSMNIKWGWKFSLNVRMSDPMNVGTSDNAVAHLQADLNYTVGTPFSSNGGMWTYDVTGLGQFRDLTSQNKALTLQIPAIEPVENAEISFN